VQQVIQGKREIDLKSDIYGLIVDEVIAGTDISSAFRHHLEDARFLTLIDQIDNRAASTDRFYREAGLSTRQRADLFVQTARAIAELQKAPNSARPDLARQTYAALVRSAGLSGSQLAAFDETPLGRALRKMAASAGK